MDQRGEAETVLRERISMIVDVTSVAKGPGSVAPKQLSKISVGLAARTIAASTTPENGQCRTSAASSRVRTAVQRAARGGRMAISAAVHRFRLTNRFGACVVALVYKPYSNRVILS